MSEDLKQRISQIRYRVRSSVPFFGHILMRMEIKADPSHGSAYVTPGFVMGINPDFAAGMTDAEIATVILHETLHAAFLYWSRSKHMTAFVQTPDGAKVPLANIAHDYVINLIIEDTESSLFEPPSTFAASWPGRKEPFKLLFDKKYRDMSFEEVYDSLLESNPPQEGGDGGRVAPEGASGDHDDTGNGSGEGDDNDNEGNGNGLANEAQQWKMVLREARHVHSESAAKGSRDLARESHEDPEGSA